MDALLLAAVARELGERVLGMRVERITQQGADVGLRLRGRLWLLCSADARFPRVHLTESRPAAAPAPPPFCQLLRRHLEGGRLAAVRQPPPLERVLLLDIDARDELGSPTVRRLVAELIPPQPNLLLLDSSGRILDCLRRVPRRDALPGRIWSPPPPQAGRIDPLAGDALARLRAGWDTTQGDPAARLARLVAGLSPARARDLLPSGTLADAERVLGELRAVLRDGDPAALVGPGSPSRRCEETIAAAVVAARQDTERHRLLQALHAHRQRVARKQEKQEAELAGAEGADQERRFGEILLARVPAIPRGAPGVPVADLEDPSREVEVPTLGQRTAAAAAQAHFRRYRKAKRARARIAEQLAATRAEAGYLDDLVVAVETAAGAGALAALTAEVVEAGYLRERARAEPQAGRRGPPRPAARQQGPQPLRFATADGLLVLVGTSAAGNDHLTMRLAAAGDVWLHARQTPGAHVILRLPPGIAEPPPTSLAEAAALAARYSAARRDSRVAVDYTRRSRVWKPRGARPGFVLYNGERTILGAPGDAERLAALPAGTRDPGAGTGSP